MFTVKIVMSNGTLVVESCATTKEIMDLINACEDVCSWVIAS